MAWLVITAGYFLGCFPTAYLTGRLLDRGDIRELGDGNPGSKNAFLVLGPKAGIAVFCIDAVKATAAILLAQTAQLSPEATMFTGIAVILGHSFPIFMGFRGGEGMACTIGILIALTIGPMLILSPLTLIVLYIKRNVDLALATMFVPIAPLCLVMHKPTSVAIYSITLPCIVAVIHFRRRYARSLKAAEE